VRLRARLRQRRHARAARSVIPLLVVAVTGLLAVPPVAGQDVAGIGAFNGVACPSNSQCVGVGIIFTTASSGAVGAAAPLTAASGAVSGGQAVQTIPGTELLSAVSCPSGTQCLAVGENSDASEGVAVPLDPETGAVVAGQSVQSIPGIFMAAVACPSSTRCLGVGHAPDGRGVAVSLDPATGAIAMGESVQEPAAWGSKGWPAPPPPSAWRWGRTQVRRPVRPCRSIRPPVRPRRDRVVRASRPGGYWWASAAHRQPCAWRSVGVRTNHRWRCRWIRQPAWSPAGNGIRPFRPGRRS
jgi:hypothetical protein